MTLEERLAELRIELPPALAPGGLYAPVVVHRGTAWVSGQLPRRGDELLFPPGRIGAELTPEQAERVAVATQLGRISLVVRSIEGVPEATGPRPSLVFGSDVSSALTGPQAPAPSTRMRVIQGGTQQEVTFR